MPKRRKRKGPPKRRSPAAALLPTFKPKRVPDRRRKATLARLAREMRQVEGEET